MNRCVKARITASRQTVAGAKSPFCLPVWCFGASDADDVMIAGLFGKPHPAVKRYTCSIQALPHSSQQTINK